LRIRWPGKIFWKENLPNNRACTRPAASERISQSKNEILCYVTVFAKLSQRSMRREDDKMDKEDEKKKAKMSQVE